MRRFSAFIFSILFAWAPIAAKMMAKYLEGSKNITYTNTTVKIFSAMNEENRAQIEDLAAELTA